MATEFKLPELGENINEAQVVSVNVAQGDTVSADQEVIEVETDKAVMPVPVPAGGTVGQVKVKEGDTLKVGDLIFTIEEGQGDGPADAEQQPAEQQASQPEPAQPAETEQPAEAPAESAEAAESAEPSQAQADQPAALEVEAPAPAAPAGSDRGTPVFAAPSVRRFAREVGVDITQVQGAGPGGRISIDDVKAYARKGPAAAGAAPAAAVELPDLAQHGPVERQAMSMIAKKTAAHMAMCWATIPHVTLHQDVDATDMEAFRNAQKKAVEKAGGKLTPTAILVKILAAGLKRYPVLNSAYDAKTQELVFRRYVHVGVAVDTPRGLVVPVLRDADTKTLAQISVELGETAAKARDGKLALEDMQGGCFTLTNLGGIGVEQFTPIVNWPEVGILGIGTARPRLVETGDDVQSRLMMPLSLSFDHRVVNGADGARFLQWLRAAIEQPLAAFLM